ncbi:MAG: TfoX/Sxy family protein [Candidatus Cloacimonetes bacterium]|jgi:TfoX/Sxy family transcriptional regulator of competence genes|nr:TfoX/Sxy family protein [Candidatus Cloacimonadota bacterium]MDD2506290.1 TfoX/Sxy family protein [Candidatus Cloacimonadota bacterium]MDD4147542.1 TfoX/Sxy family protein [Candidatus Cloacimonadota bacterium]MDD4559890.1 TfoX/Sxy family protein [Candidatus Cloacimonadota bacterium]
MASTAETMEYILERLQALPGVYSRKMFGEYAFYYMDKVIAMLCDDQLFVKPTIAGKAYLGNPEYAPPYSGAKDYFLIPEDMWDDSISLCELFRISEPEIKKPARKKPKST